MKKTLKISTETHQQIKLHCVRNNVKLNEWVENCLKEGLKFKKLYSNKINLSLKTNV